MNSDNEYDLSYVDPSDLDQDNTPIRKNSDNKLSPIIMDEYRTPMKSTPMPKSRIKLPTSSKSIECSSKNSSPARSNSVIYNGYYKLNKRSGNLQEEMSANETSDDRISDSFSQRQECKSKNVTEAIKAVEAEEFYIRRRTKNVQYNENIEKSTAMTTTTMTTTTPPPPPPPPPSSPPTHTWFIDRMLDPNVPYMLSIYLQVVLNAFIFSVVGYLILIVARTIVADINHKIENYTKDAIEEIQMCQKSYEINQCGKEHFAPILEKSCLKWKKCMNRDPTKIGRSKISAETLADIVNGFFKPMTWKSLIFFNMLMGSVMIINYGFQNFRSRNYDNAIYRKRYEEMKKENDRLMMELRMREQDGKRLDNMQMQMHLEY